MNLRSHDPVPWPVSGRQPARTPAAIRAALLPEDIGVFDTQFRAAMREASETFDLTVVHECLDRWWGIAWSSQNPERHRAAMDAARRLVAGEAVATSSWAEIATRRDLPTLP